MTGATATAWLYLAAAIVVEVGATTGLRLTDGLRQPTAAAAVAAGYVLSYVALAQALKAGLEVSVAYAVWSGVGTAAIAVIGGVWLGESMHLLKVAGIFVIIAGVTLVNLSSRTVESDRHPAAAAAAFVTAPSSLAVLAAAAAADDLSRAVGRLREAPVSNPGLRLVVPGSDRLAARL